jgi:hypothetical protein
MTAGNDKSGCRKKARKKLRKTRIAKKKLYENPIVPAISVMVSLKIELH